MAFWKLGIISAFAVLGSGSTATAYTPRLEICEDVSDEGDYLYESQDLSGDFKLVTGLLVVIFSHCDSGQQIKVKHTSLDPGRVREYFLERVASSQTYSFEELGAGLSTWYDVEYLPISAALCRCINEES